MNDDETVTIPIIPVDTSRLPVPPGVQVPKPSIEHLIIACAKCGNDGWIGPHQHAYYRAGTGVPLCYHCLFVKFRADDFPGAHVIALDPHADDKPRRT